MRADVEIYLALAVLSGQKEQLRDDQPGHALLNHPVDHNDALAQEARIEIVSPFTASGGFNHGWNK